MPHFVIECSPGVLENTDATEIVRTVYDQAEASGLFGPGAIKARLKPYEHYITGGDDKDFLHVFGNIMGGRTDEQKKNLSESIVKALKELLPEVPVISMNIYDFYRPSYTNRDLV